MRILKNLFESIADIPNNYIYISGKGNKFIKKDDTWINASTKKSVPESNIQMLERSAKKRIDDYNSTHDVKIGSTVTSNKGTEYTFTGTGFVSKDGKVLSGGAAKSALDKLQKITASNVQDTEDNSEESTNNDKNSVKDGNEEPNTEYKSPLDNVIPGDSTIDDEDIPELNDTTPSSTSSIVSRPEKQSTDNSTDNTDDELTTLAKNIRNSKYNRYIITLLNRGGTVDLIAADILLSGDVQGAIKNIKALNNSNK